MSDLSDNAEDGYAARRQKHHAQSKASKARRRSRARVPFERQPAVKVDSSDIRLSIRIGENDQVAHASGSVWDPRLVVGITPYLSQIPVEGGTTGTMVVGFGDESDRAKMNSQFRRENGISDRATAIQVTIYTDSEPNLEYQVVAAMQDERLRNNPRALAAFINDDKERAMRLVENSASASRGGKGLLLGDRRVPTNAPRGARSLKDKNGRRPAGVQAARGQAVGGRGRRAARVSPRHNETREQSTVNSHDTQNTPATAQESAGARARHASPMGQVHGELDEEEELPEVLPEADADGYHDIEHGAACDCDQCWLALCGGIGYEEQHEEAESECYEEDENECYEEDEGERYEEDEEVEDDPVDSSSTLGRR